MKKLIKYPFQKLYNFFLWSSGADLEILKQAPTDANKYFGIGGTIVFTALMASFAGGYAFFTAFKNPISALFFGLFWGALIFNLDRYIVSTFGVGDGKKTISRQEALEAAPRIIMAALLGFVISTPLELKLFESEINAKIAQENLVTLQDQKTQAINTAEQQNLYFYTEIKTLRSNIEKRQKELEKKITFRDIAYDKYMCELNGECGTRVPGDGPVFREAKENYLKLASEYTVLENKYRKLDNIDSKTILDYQTTINANIVKGTRQAAKTETDINGRNGLLARLKAMGDLTNENDSLWYAKWLITLLFIFIEIAPIMFKMMTERGTYDDILDRIKHEAKVKQLLLQSNINEDINTAVKVHADKNSQKLNAELIANKDLLESISKSQAEIAQVAIEEWKKEQLIKVRDNPSSMIKS